PQQAAPRPPAPTREAPPREAPAREATLRLRMPGLEGNQAQATSGGSARVEGATTTPASPDQRNPTPPYPSSSRLAGREGTVAVRIEVGPDGSVTNVLLTGSAGDPALDDSALATIRRWRFRPATRDGVQVAATVTTNVHFRLDGRR
ncbi:energy transducer TonB, partial [Plastoroseomonas arctica]